MEGDGSSGNNGWKHVLDPKEQARLEAKFEELFPMCPDGKRRRGLLEFPAHYNARMFDAPKCEKVSSKDVVAERARAALKRYNDTTSGENFEYVDLAAYNSILRCEIIYHLNFWAKPSSSSGDDIGNSAKLFFAEITQLSRNVTACSILDPSTAPYDNCEHCARCGIIQHPDEGFMGWKSASSPDSA